MFASFAVFVALAALIENIRKSKHHERVNAAQWKKISTLEKRIKRLENNEPEIPLAAVVEFYQLINGEFVKVEDTMFIKIDESKTAKIVVKDAKGNPAAIDGKPQWAVSDESLATLEVSGDGLSAKVTPVGPLGACKLQAKCDADLGEGVKEILGEADLEFIAGEAVSVELSFE